MIFTVEDIDLFASISHDYNPLHCNYAYAHRTPYGERVVHGILGVLVCLGRLVENNNDISLSQLKVKFWKPLFCDVPYSISLHKINESSVKIMLLDGEAKLLEIWVAFPEKPGIVNKPVSQLPNDIFINKSNDINMKDIKAGQLFEGDYGIKQDEMLLLLRKNNLCGSSLEYISVILLWSSYFIGMIMPGQQALYAGLNFEIDRFCTGSNMSLKYSVKTQKFDARFNLLDMEFNCFHFDGNKMAHGNLSAFVRPKINYNRPAISSTLIQDSEKLSGKTALITGASRGLGSMLARFLAAMSCHVIVNFQNSHKEAINLQKCIIDTGGSAEIWQGDIADIDWLNSKKEELLSKDRVIDILVCNACQPPKELLFEQNTVLRILAYINKNLEMTCVPLSIFAPMLDNNYGYGIIISSEVVTNPIALWPHYTGLKTAIEGLISSIAIKYNKTHWFIVRPPKLLTDMTNSPVSNRDAADPFLIAKYICERIFINAITDVFKSVEIITSDKLLDNE